MYDLRLHMRETTVTLDELAKRKIRVTECILLPGETLRIVSAEGDHYLLNNAEIVRRYASHIIVRSGRKKATLRLVEPRYTWKAALSTVAMLVVAGAGLFVSLLGQFGGSRPPSVDERIQELAAIQKSLRELDSYVDAQRSTLSTLSRDVARLQVEKQGLSQAVSLDRRQVAALLQVQASEQRRRELVSVVLSFVVGVLSSVTATIVISLFRKRHGTKLARAPE
jgi:hypothetical protein